MAQNKFDTKAKNRFLKHFRLHGLVCSAAKAANVSAVTVRAHRKDNAKFEEAYTNALELYRDDIESEAYRRATEGVEEDKYYKGAYSHTVKHYSDRLMELLLKRHRPEYRDKIAIDANVSGGVLILPASQMTSKEWEEGEDGKDG